MHGAGALQIIVYFSIILLLVKPLGWYMAQVFSGKSTALSRIILPIEKFIYRLCHIDATAEMSWKSYLISMLVFNIIGIIGLYLLLRLQNHLPLNPQSFAALEPFLAFNTAISFTTNTNWQAYSGESTLSYLSQMIGVTVQQFLSAGTGLALFVAFVRGFTRHETTKIGNFWVDLLRSILYILLPLALFFAVLLSACGVLQNLKPYQTFTPLQSSISQQLLPMGPVASQVAIKQLGTNGGGFFNTNSAHPFENPTPLTNFIEMLEILLLPAACCYTFGLLVNDKRQGWALFVTMFVILVPLMLVTVCAELSTIPIDHTWVTHGNMEGKETRFGIVGSSMWAILTTATANGSVNSMLDSFTPIGGLIPLWLMHLGEVIFGGVGSGLYGMLMLVIIAVFISGLMVGRTPEYLGKKIEPYEMKMASLAVLLMPLIVLITTATAIMIPQGFNAILNPGSHGLSELLYAFTSMGNNNGSAFAGLKSDTPFFNLTGGIVMLLLRYWVAIPTLAIAGSLIRKKRIPTTSGTLQTHNIIFIILLIFVIMINGALTFFPPLSLGPIVEHLMLGETHGN